MAWAGWAGLLWLCNFRIVCDANSENRCAALSCCSELESYSAPDGFLDNDAALMRGVEEMDAEQPLFAVPKVHSSWQRWFRSKYSRLFNASWAMNSSALHQIRRGLLSNRLVIIHNALERELALRLQSEAQHRSDWTLDVHPHRTRPPLALLRNLSLQHSCEKILGMYQASPCYGKFHFCKQSALLDGSVSSEMQTIMNSPDILHLMQSLSDSELNRFEGARLSLYKPGDYVLLHTDHEAGRMLSFTLYLTSSWQHGSGGEFFWCGGRGPKAKVHRIQPGFNSLVLFRTSLDSLHMVSVVEKHVQQSRYALQGWFTSKHPNRTQQNALITRLTQTSHEYPIMLNVP